MGVASGRVQATMPTNCPEQWKEILNKTFSPNASDRPSTSELLSKLTSSI